MSSVTTVTFDYAPWFLGSLVGYSIPSVFIEVYKIGPSDPLTTPVNVFTFLIFFHNANPVYYYLLRRSRKGTWSVTRVLELGELREYSTHGINTPIGRKIQTDSVRVSYGQQD